MAHAKNHDYHILPPSLHPLVAAVGTFIMLFGAVLWMQGITPWVFAIGLIAVLYSMFVWWADVVTEGQTRQAGGPEKSSSMPESSRSRRCSSCQPRRTRL